MRLIDAITLENDNWNVFEDEHGFPVKYVLVEDIRNAPTVDAVEVVRCGECKAFGREIMPSKHDCKKYMMPYCRETDFCSYGERKE